MMQTLRSADNSLLLDPSLLAPLHPEEHIEIVNGTVQVIDTKDETHLSEVLSAMPKIIETMAASATPTPLQRLNLSGRIQILNTQVAEFNDKIQATGWITFLHVILCILTLGIFRLRSVLELEPVPGSASDLFPKETDWNKVPGQCAQEELETFMASMLEHGHPEVEEQLQRFLQTSEKKKEEDKKPSPPPSPRSPSPLPKKEEKPEIPFAEQLAAVLSLEPKEKGERIERIKTLVQLFIDSFITYPATQEEHFRALGVDTHLPKKTEEKHPRETIRECFHKESVAEILEAFGLQNADWETGKNDPEWQKTGNFPAGDAHSWWIYLLSHDQYEQLPEAVFLLLTPKIVNAVNIGDEKWKERYLRCDPSLEKLQSFAKNGVFLPRVLFPIYPEDQISISQKTVEKLPLARILPFLLNTDSDEGKSTAGYIARLLSSEQIEELSPEQLKKAGSHLLRKELSHHSFNHVTLEPQNPDPNLTKWISRLVKEGAAKELDAIVEGLISAEGIAFLQGFTAEFLWSFVSCLAKIKASNLSFLCSLIGESKWSQMLEEPNNDTLCLLFTSGVLEEQSQALPRLLLQGDVTKLPAPLLRAATKTTCGKISDLNEKNDYPNLRIWISRLIEIDAKEQLLSHIALQFANVYSQPPLLNRSEPQFLWNFLGYIGKKASKNNTLLQRICQYLGDPTWEKMAKGLDQTALPSLLQVGAGAEIGKFLSPEQIQALPTEIAKRLAPHACKGAAHFSKPNFLKLEAWIEKLIAIDAKAELGAAVQEVSQNRAFLSAANPPFLWKFLPYVAANCPKTEQYRTETPVQKICSRIENLSWKKMAGELDEVALTSLLPAKVGGEIGQFLSPEQIQALSPENAKALAPHACKNAKHLGENDYLKLEAWITKLLDIKAEPELVTITKEVRLNHRFLQAATTPFLWKFLAYIPTIVPGPDLSLQEVVPIVCEFIGKERWPKLLKEPNPLTLAALFNKGGFKKTYETFMSVLDILKKQDFSDKTLLSCLVAGCTNYTHFSGDQQKALGAFKAQCETKLKN